MEPKVKLKLDVAFEGTRYHGWQAQANAFTVQQCLEKALRNFFPSVRRVHGAGRTDTGVHALGMVAHVEIPPAEMRLTVRELPLALNSALPKDIRIMKVCEVDLGFHAQYDCLSKEYRYQIWNHRSANPLLHSTAWHVPGRLDLQSMREAARLLVGKRDFRALSASHSYEIEDTVRELYQCRVKSVESLIVVVMIGDGFLYKMCRVIVGLLLRVGKGKMLPKDVIEVLNERKRNDQVMTAPAHGLVLYKVKYPDPD